MLLSKNTLLQNRYLIEGLIAQGGMGAVYQATDQRLGNTVALKQILIRDDHMRDVLEREARLLANLQHPVLPVVSDHFAEQNNEFLVMQYIPGDDLGMLLTTRRSDLFAPADVLRWADQLLDALDYLHSQRPPIFHRDIKPRNLKLTPRQDIILLDFGLAKGSQISYGTDGSGRNIRLLTPEYAPLEQIQGNDTDPRSDLYSLAATLYHLLTGVVPTDALTRAAMVLSDQTDPLSPANELNPQVPPAVAVILHQALSHNMEQRFSSAAAMRSALNIVSRSGRSRASGDISVMSSGQTTLPVSSREEPAPQTAITSSPETTTLPSVHILVVSGQGGGHYRTIGEAITNARTGTRILVRPGLYREQVVLDRSLEIIGDGQVSDIFLENTDAPCIRMASDYAVVRSLSIRGRASQEGQEYGAIDIPQGRLVLEDCDISSDSRACISISGSKANPIIWRCQIHDGKQVGILVSDRGQGILEECDIFSNNFAGVEIRQIGNPIIRQCKIHHGERDGIYVNEKGAGVIEGCDIFGNVRAGIAIHRGGNVFVRLCQIHNQLNGYGVYVYDKGEGTLEACNIFDNTKAGVGITQGGNPFIRRCKIHHEQQRGVFIFETGEGTIERCYILSNADTGITIGQNSNPLIRRCHINKNGSYAVRVLAGGAGMVEESNLTGNAQGAWDLAKGNRLVQRENKE